MGKINWMEKLGWTEDHIEDLRFAGYSYLKQGKYDIAIDFFEALVVLNSQSAYDTQTLGALYLELGRPAEAVKILEIALKNDPEHSPSLLNMTKALFLLEKFDDALQLAEILQKEPDPGISNVAKALILAYG